MLHSHEGLDRPEGVARAGMLAPLRRPGFRLLWGGMCVSLIGDGIFLVAMAWQVYELSNAPTALSLVGIAMTVPTILFLVLGGVASDRFDRRRIMVAADLVRALVVGTLAVLSLAGVLEVWHIAALVAVYGTGAAFFAPAFDALVADVLPAHELPQANALDQVVRPIALRLAGPAVGGLLVGTLGAGPAFGLDGISFLVSCIALLAVRRPAGLPAVAAASVGADLREGWRFVRERPWLWATFASAAVAYLLFMGPVEVLLPFIVKTTLDGSASDFGLVLAAGGLGSVGCALVVGRRRVPRDRIGFIYVVWTVATLAVAGYGLATAVWQLAVAAFVFNGLETAGTIVWATAKQQHVPRRLLGRVSSLDWLISIGLLPLSFALTGPVTALIGARATLVGAGVLGALATLAAFLVPRVRQVSSGPSSVGAAATAGRA